MKRKTYYKAKDIILGNILFFLTLSIMLFIWNCQTLMMEHKTLIQTLRDINESREMKIRDGNLLSSIIYSDAVYFGLLGITLYIFWIFSCDFAINLRKKYRLNKSWRSFETSRQKKVNTSFFHPTRILIK